MANNRMYLKNKRTGEQVLLAKYFSGWQVFHGDLGCKLNELFANDDREHSQWGDNDWLIEYETEIDDQGRPK